MIRVRINCDCVMVFFSNEIWMNWFVTYVNRQFFNAFIIMNRGVASLYALNLLCIWVSFASMHKQWMKRHRKMKQMVRKKQQKQKSGEKKTLKRTAIVTESEFLVKIIHESKKIKIDTATIFFSVIMFQLRRKKKTTESSYKLSWKYT